MEETKSQEKITDEISERKKFSTASLWNNSMVQSALSSMSYDDLEKYKKIGESMYSSIDFETSSVIDTKNNIPFFLTDAAAYITDMLKSGIHPSDLTDNEKFIMENVFGKDWYTSYGYVEGDLTEIVTIVHNEK